ncbi:FlgO family outer membrane protein [Persicitalea jodogahamensis]|uniref:FlgO domain-containing protein n=1 Tax=Persicitalea jodogahamensis TaxID=402147 RepID=A0A8J3D8L0_9BACT|nr:FlgO family outer membrane protein [Persicitalea jodogahamensis]GHB88950.1 hypothetical protein GCM10007390_51350 [Persicitalea jodogahamensis]
MKYALIFISMISACLPSNAQYEAQIKSITQEIGNKVAETGKKRIAVADFMDANGVVTKLGQFLSEEFNTALPESGQGFQVIDRSRLNDLMRENKLGPLSDPETAVKLGKLAGIEALIYGTITPLGESVRVNIKILDIQRAVILRAFAGNITRTADINTLLGAKAAIQVDDFDTSSNDKSSPDCGQKRTCTICITNKSELTIEAKPSLNTIGKEILLHPGERKCWTQAQLSGTNDYLNTQLYYYQNRTLFKRESITIEPCKTYNLFFTKK